MSIMYYKLNGFNDPSLKHVFVASLPKEIQPELQRQFTIHQLDIANLSLGKIYQLAINCLERLYYDEQTAFVLAEKEDYSESDHVFVIQTVQQIQKVQLAIPIPSIKIHLLSGRFDKPIPIIGFVNTGAQKSMLNPSILPSHFWEKHTEYFKAANGELFHTDLITKKLIGIQFFPGCVLWTKLVGSNLPDKDLLIGFDVLQLVKKLHITASGIRYKQMFQPYTDSLKLFSISSSSPSYDPLKSGFLIHCPESHSQFLHPAPLWKNENFFIKLPFKLNKDVNLTKATHPGMTPTDLKLAQEECSQLLKQGLIESTYSEWACQAFYVEKRSEIVRGKKRLVIDYQPLNCFLKDDKFPLPKIQSLFVHIQNAKVFSKFDLKIQQFLGIINYFREFFPYVAVHTNQFSKMLKKSAPLWGPSLTVAIQHLKNIAQHPPPLRIPTDGQRILQTDASDEYWGAILLEKHDGKESYCAHASGQFKESEKHYHVIYKEIIAVKYGIQKFEFHLIGHNFLVRLDNSSFPKIIEFKNKVLPNKHLLRLKTWFSKYDFTVQHIKGD
ncbi:hypothetical protein KPL70_017281 [Citrus sinensis]|nr:hypothetical protein KPL70_017281 [Citrus sinensis]